MQQCLAVVYKHTIRLHVCWWITISRRTQLLAEGYSRKCTSQAVSTYPPPLLRLPIKLAAEECTFRCTVGGSAPVLLQNSSAAQFFSRSGQIR